MQQVNTRGGIFAGEGDAYGGGVFDGNESGFGGLGATYEQAAAGIGRAEGGLRYGAPRSYRDGSLGADAEQTFPWGQYSDSTAGLQADVNKGLLFNGYCPIAVDGKLGPATCGASKLVLGGAPTECQSFNFKPSKCASAGGSVSTDTSKPYPWHSYSDNTLGLQVQLNDILYGRQECPIGQDGKLGAETCGAAKYLTEQGVTQVGGWPKECQSFSFTAKSCPHAADEPVPIDPPPPATPPLPPAPTQQCPSGQFMDPVTGACALLAPAKKSSATMWIVGGLLGAAVLGGIAYAAKKKAA